MVETPRNPSRIGARTSNAEDLFPMIYEELHRIASQYLSGERPDHTLQPTALVHEAYLKLMDPEGGSARFRSRQHFFRTAARAMRRVLVDSARSRQSDKRGGDRSKLPMDIALELFEEGGVDLVALDDALAKLSDMDPQLSQIVELKFFTGLTIQETAQVLEVSTPTVERGWRTARLWLRTELSAR